MTHWRQKPVDVEGRFRAAYGPSRYQEAPVRPPSGPRWALVTFWIAFTVLLAVLSSAAFGTSGYWRCGDGPHRNVNGMDCCDLRDCVPISNELGWTAKVGSQVEVTIRDGRDVWTHPVTINTIYPSCDASGRSWICTTGCLFRAPGF